MTYKSDSKVGIVVVTFNRLNLLKESIDALRSQTYKNRDIIIVNNGSTDGTGDWLASQKDLIVITQANLGGAGGFNRGMRFAAERDYDFCWVMDDDVICEPNALEELLNATNVIQGDWGFLCSSVIDKNGNPCNVPIVINVLRNKYPDWPRYLEYGIVEVIRATFVSVLVPTKHIKKYGLPIKDFFIWGDDSEFTDRMAKHYPCFMIGKSKVTHMRELAKGLVFLKETNPNRIMMYKKMYRNGFYVARHCYPIKDFPTLRFYTRATLMMLEALFKLKLKHFYVLLSGTFEALFFHPSIEYLDLKEDNNSIDPNLTPKSQLPNADQKL